LILVSGLSIEQGTFSLTDVSFEVAHGHYAVLMGKTGSGKTSLLEAICGLRAIQRGKIFLENLDMTHWPAAARGIGYVPQDGVLFQTMTVRDQLGFALQIRATKPREIAARVEELSELLEIRHLLPRYPKGLSGGEAQRVALGRALSFRPRILLLDEPLSALDDETRHHMYQVLVRVKQHANITALHVTHSLSEARALADVILWLADGQIRAEPSVTPRENSA
jgi:molybdate/tungstate transport system ATP-binding protein